MENTEKTPHNGSQKNKDDVAYKKDQANGNIGDPSSKRNIGANGATQRDNQKDELKNLHIAGNETTGYGASTSDAGEGAAGPGFEVEGSEYHNDNPVKEE